jgi:hypothetical protein
MGLIAEAVSWVHGHAARGVENYIKPQEGLTLEESVEELRRN